MERQFEQIAKSPYLVAERKEFTPPVRILPYERHLVVYQIEDDGILIVRVLHASMDIPAHLSER